MEDKLPTIGQIELLNKYLTGDISPEGIAEAEKLISSDKACNTYWEKIFFLEYFLEVLIHLLNTLNNYH